MKLLDIGLSYSDSPFELVGNGGLSGVELRNGYLKRVDLDLIELGAIGPEGGVTIALYIRKYFSHSSFDGDTSVSGTF